VKGIAMANSALIQVRVEPQLKSDVDNTLAANGLDIPTAIRIFLTKVQQVGGIPFEVRTYNAKTIAAMEEANRIAVDPNAKSYGNFDELLADIDVDN
jgi:DNA-damage-inducible protein J